MAEEGFDVRCVDDTTGKEMPWTADRRAREEELKYCRDFGMYEKVCERTAIATCGVTPVDTKWIDAGKNRQERAKFFYQEKRTAHISRWSSFSKTS